MKSSILVKMLLGLGLPVLVVFVVSFFVILNTSQKPVTALTNDVLNAKSQTAAAEVGEFFTRYMEVAKQMSANSGFESLLEKTGSGQKLANTAGFDEIYKTMVNVQKMYPDNILAAWTADFDSSQYTQSDGQSSDASYNVTARPWYKQVQAANGPIITAPYVDAASKKTIVSAVAPVYNSAKQMIGVTCIDFAIDTLQSMMKAYKLGNTGFFILVAADGTIIYYPDTQYLQKNVSETDLSDNVKTAVKNKQTGEITYTAQGKTVHGYLALDTDTGFAVISAMPSSEYAGTLNAMSATINTIFIIAAALLLLLIVLISMSLIRPIQRLKKAANEIAEGSLDVVLSTRSNDEIGQVAQALSRTVDRLRDYINYINEVATILDQIAVGNLVFDFKYDYSGEFSKIKTSMLSIQSTLSDYVSQMTTAAEHVTASSGFVSNSSVALSQGATEQASAIEELTASIQEVAAQTDRNAGNAEKVDTLSQSAKGNAAGGNARMRDMLAAMEDISISSSKIGSIIKVIDDIAFQTNILALNAAVEAARAGNAGKGFAVVAEEVRTLASRSANAAKETTELIETSIRKVETGTKIARETAESLSMIVTEVDKVAELVATIAAASQEQASSIDQINSGVSQVSQVIQNNAATSEESAAASEELLAQAAQLKQIVSIFKLSQNKITPKATFQSSASAGFLSEGTPRRKNDRPNILLDSDNYGKY